MVLAEQGFRILKFFPADAAGGLAWLKAVGAPLAGLRFCPTGGIGADTAQAYLSLANVACVGGSWVAPRSAVVRRDWSQIERLAAAAAELQTALASRAERCFKGGAGSSVCLHEEIGDCGDWR